MRLEKRALVVVALCLVTGFTCSSAFGQVNLERIAALRSRVNQLKASFDKIPARQRKILSGGALNLIKLAENWDKLEASMEKSAAARRSRGSLRAPASVSAGDPRV